MVVTYGVTFQQVLQTNRESRRGCVIYQENMAARVVLARTGHGVTSAAAAAIAID